MAKEPRYFIRKGSSTVVGFHPTYELDKDMVECSIQGIPLGSDQTPILPEDQLVAMVVGIIPELDPEKDFTKTDGKPKCSVICDRLGLKGPSRAPRDLPVTPEIRERALAIIEQRKVDASNEG
jgi:hypothetical protein